MCFDNPLGYFCEIFHHLGSVPNMVHQIIQFKIDKFVTSGSVIKN